MNAAGKWVVPPGYRVLADFMQEHGPDHVQTKLMSGQSSAFKLHLNTGDLSQFRRQPGAWPAGAIGSKKRRVARACMLGLLRGRAIFFKWSAMLSSFRQTIQRTQTVGRCASPGANGCCSRRASGARWGLGPSASAANQRRRRGKKSFHRRIASHRDHGPPQVAQNA